MLFHQYDQSYFVVKQHQMLSQQQSISESVEDEWGTSEISVNDCSDWCNFIIMQKVATKFRELFQLECLRYKRKGLLNTLIAMSLLVLIINLAHLFCHNYWPAHIQRKQLFVVGVSFCIHFVCQAGCFCIYAPGYSDLSPVYEKYRINPGVERPWDKPAWAPARNRLFTYLGINYFIIYPAVIFGSLKISGIKVRFEELPSILELAWQLLFVSVVEDCFFYWMHRLSHSSKLLYRFHKIHHEYTQNFSLVTQYTHPIDYFIGILIPSAMPFLLLGSRAHCFMLFFWQVWKIFISTQGHCGYYFPWSPTRIFVCVSDPSFHDYHHTRNIGNYAGSIYLWDFFLGTASSYLKLWKSDCRLREQGQPTNKK